MAALVRQESRDGAELIEFLFAVVRGKRKAPLRLRLEACRELLDRGFGKVPQPLEHAGEDGGPITHEYRIVFDD